MSVTRTVKMWEDTGDGRWNEEEHQVTVDFLNGTMVYSSIGRNGGSVVVDANGGILATVPSGQDFEIAGGQLLLPDGTDTVPSFARSAASATGLFFGANALIFANNNDGKAVFAEGAKSFRVASDWAIGWSSAVDAWNNGADVELYRDAADILAQRRSTNAQTFKLYGTFTDASNYTRAVLKDDGAGTVTLAAETAGTGADDIDIDLTPAGTGGVNITIGKLGIGAAFSPNADLKLEAGRLMLKESLTPTADPGYAKVYTKAADNAFYFQDGAGVEHQIQVSGTSIASRSYAMADFGNAATHYVGGFYEAPAAHVVLTIGGTVIQTFGTAGRMKAAHAFVVASGAGGTDLVLTVTGISIGEDGARNDADTEIIVADADAAITDQYFETTKKWLGQITYTLTGSSGAFTFNYGFAKYDDFEDRPFTVTAFEMHLEGAASETGFNIELCHHESSGWTYHASAFVPGAEVIVSSLTDNSSTNDNFASGDEVAYKRVGLSHAVAGESGEGIVVRIITAVNNSISAGTCHVAVLI